jgi:uncharacterized protein YdeI (YjbR/CyaY-like superfamily)
MDFFAEGGAMKNANTDPRVDAYVEKAAGFAQPILRHLRKLVHKACPEAEETLKWRMPTFTYRGKILCGMAAFQQHCTFGFWHKDMVAVLGSDGDPAQPAMGSLGRITSLADLPPNRRLSGYIRKAVALHESDVPARPRAARAPSAPLRVPADLAAALKRNKTASAHFEKFSPSRRKEYIEWITEAKRDETRQKRLGTALEWIAEGKSRNWKYENC